MKEKVIHVDDDSGITIVMGFNLNEYNHLPFNPQPHDEAEKVANQVLDALDDDEQAVILMDHSLDRMEKLKGWDVIDQLLETGLPAGVIIVVLSSEVTKIEDKYRERGISHFLDKAGGSKPVKELLAEHFSPKE